MSPRAAWRLESLGFTSVYDYAAGKAAWLASGLPTEGTEVDVPRAGGVARKDVPTCLLTDRLGAVVERLNTVEGGLCVVLNDAGVVMGRLRERALAADPTLTVAQVMEPGPTTIRPDEPLEAITERMRARGTSNVIVTSMDGRLFGVLYRSDAEKRLGKGRMP